MNAKVRAATWLVVLGLVGATTLVAATCGRQREQAAERSHQELVDEDRAIRERMKARAAELGCTGGPYEPVGHGQLAADPESRELRRRRLEVSEELDAIEAAHPRLKGRGRQ